MHGEEIKDITQPIFWIINSNNGFMPMMNRCKRDRVKGLSFDIVSAGHFCCTVFMRVGM